MDPKCHDALRVELERHLSENGRWKLLLPLNSSQTEAHTNIARTAAAADAVNHVSLIRIVWELATYDRCDDRKPYTQGSAPQSHS